MKIKAINLLIITILFITLPIFTDAELNIGDSFIYEITNARHFISIGDTTDKSDGYVFGNQNLPINTRINASVEYIQDYDISFRFWADNNSRVGFIQSNWLDSLGLYYSYFVLFNTYEIVGNPSYSNLLNLYLYQIRPFIVTNHNDYFISPDTFGEDIRYFFSRWSYLYPDIETSFNYSMKNNKLIFESWIGGMIDASFGRILTDKSDYPSDITFGNNFHFAIDNESGLVHGFGLRGWVKGKINKKSVKVSMICDYELEGYDMQDYQLGEFIDFNSENGTNSNLYYLFFLPGITTVGVIVSVIYRRRKKLKLGNTES